MATKDETARKRINDVKTDVRSTSTCSNATVTTLQELLIKKIEEPTEKENVRIKASGTGRRRAGTAPALADTIKQTSIALTPKEKYILATEVANATLKTLADVLKKPASALVSHTVPQSKPAAGDDARKPTRPRTGHTKTTLVSQRPLKERAVSQMNSSPKKPSMSRSSSYSSSSTSSPDAGLVSMAECAMIAFAYLGTPEAMKVLGKDSQELQYENGILVLIGKFIALGLDHLAVKELRVLKKRLDRYLGHDAGKRGPAPENAKARPQRGANTEKESLATLLDFGTIALDSPALPIIASFQTYTLRIIAKLKKPRMIEAAWEFLKLSNPSSAANLIWHLAKTTNGQIKAARQLESLAQTLLALCPSVSSADDASQFQPSPDTVLLLQHLAFTLRKQWWTLAQHQGSTEQELLEPFSKCVIAFARRSQLSPSKQYRLAESLYMELVEQRPDPGTRGCDEPERAAAITKTLCSLAQAAGLPNEALRWLGSSHTALASGASTPKHTAKIIRIATVSMDASIKGASTTGLEEAITNALDALKGSFGGSSLDLESLFMEVNGLRRTATRLLVAHLSKAVDLPASLSIEEKTFTVIASSVHFSARFVGPRLEDGNNAKAQLRRNDRSNLVRKCLKSIVDSVLSCCKRKIGSEVQWKELDALLQECSHILQGFEQENNVTTTTDSQESQLIQSCIVKLSNAYWTMHVQLRKEGMDLECMITAMQRSIDLIQPRSQVDRESAHLSMKLEQLGESLGDLDRAECSRKAFAQCIQSYINPTTTQLINDRAARYSLIEIFNHDEQLQTLARVLKAYHRSFLKYSIRDASELAFYDDDKLQAGVRGALLEWQLALYLRTLTRNRQWDSMLNNSVVSLAERLYEIYTPETHPLRRLRLSITLLHLSQSYPDILSKEFTRMDVPITDLATVSSSEDAGLMMFAGHLKALHNLKLSMQQPIPLTSTFRECFSTWESLVESAASWESLTSHVDNVEDWLQEIQVSVEFLNAKGEEYLALPILHLVVKVIELQRSSDTSDLVTALCALGLQFLHLGYTGKAGLSFAKAEPLVQQQTTSTEARLRWHMGYAEYLLGIGNVAKCATIMSDARSITLLDHQFMSLAKPSTTLSGRVRFNRILADASYVYALLSTTNGSYKEAARHAKQCVILNRRIWAALESTANAKKGTTTNDTESDFEGASRVAFDPLSSMRNNKGMPLVTSVTHDALNGAAFWSLVPALYRALMQHSQIYAHQGLLQEAIFVAEQAEKVASATQSPTLITDNASWRADCWAQSGRTDKAEATLKSIDHVSSRRCLSVVGYHSALARLHHSNGQYDEEVASYYTLKQLLEELSSPSYITSLDTILPSVDSLTKHISNMALDTTDTTQISKAKQTTRGRKPAAKTTRTVSKPGMKARPKNSTATAIDAGAKFKRQVAIPANPNASGIATECSVLSIMRTNIMDREVLTHILLDDLTTALDLLGQAEKIQYGMNQEISHMWAAYKTSLAQSVKQIAEDFTVNTLPESTIAFPAIGSKERILPEEPQVKRTALAPSTTTKGGRAKKLSKEDFVHTLRDARDRLVEAHGLSATNRSNHLFQQISMALGHVTVLLSAVSGSELHGSLHPLYAAYMSEIPKCNSLLLSQESIEAEKEQMTRDEYLQWPVTTPSRTAISSVLEFQKAYIDIIPKTWAALSLSLNETRDELYITRYESGLSPFVLRLPLARHASRDLDEEVFSFEDGKRDFDEIIELSDFSTKTAKDMTSREARQQWWTEREALDTRLHELLINMENIWLGGFKGIFSQHDRQPALLARFRKSLDNILNQHLPSRRKKTQQKRPVLDTQVLELFIGLGDATNEEVDLDEALMDLIYFVVDILQLNGERNAYDEIDFDAIVVETSDALRAYHSASHKIENANRHTILVLDKNLHAFPWESLPCLDQLSISRLPSLAALRERLQAARASRTQLNASPGHYICVDAGGSSILNPSGDLSHTLKTIKPRLDKLQGPWNHIANRTPSEKEFEDSLGEKDLLLYFGHGSGAQYVKSKSIRRLYSSQQNEQDRRPGCATTLLFGCSSVHLTENGIYELSGMLASYLTAGAPAVVGMLWDVTDKDCDRLAVKAGELWGLWPVQQEDHHLPKTPVKTPARKVKGKGRVAQLVSEVDSTNGPGNARNGKKGKEVVGEGMHLYGDLQTRVALDEAVKDARKSCVLRYLNGAAAVVYGIPVYLE
ncbi:peptidase family C50-domain-containing protein [Pyrenochaeta sp. MPI-SDFR-AT-0127]|nr:peptidase family C50-domain-containing protein [Pyrenochaeta sp. MPI-SDFR-AT-0127]